MVKKLVMRTIFSNAFASAVKIQKVFRGFQERKVYLIVKRIRNEAASQIQRAYKRYRVISIVPKALKYLRNQQTLMVQTYMRGFKGKQICLTSLDFSRIRKIIRTKQMHEAFEYFSKLREGVLEEVSSTIAFAFRRYSFNKRVLKRRQIKELKEEVEKSKELTHSGSGALIKTK